MLSLREICSFCGHRLGRPDCAWCDDPHAGRQPSPRADALEPGTVLLERYAVGRALRRDPLGWVYVGTDLRLGAPRRVRELFPPVAAVRAPDGRVTVRPGFDEAAWASFQAWFEAKIREHAAIASPGLLAVKDSGSAFGTRVVVFEALEGSDHADAAAGHGDPWSPEEVARMALQVLSVLRVFHERGVAHGGIHPRTVGTRFSGEHAVVDLGWCQPELTPPQGQEDAIFFPLERIETGREAPHHDFFALGVTAWTLLRGRTPDVSALRDLVAREHSDPLYRAISDCLRADGSVAATDLEARFAFAAKEPGPVEAESGRAEAQGAGDAGARAVGRSVGVRVLAAVGVAALGGALWARGIGAAQLPESLRGAWERDPAAASAFPRFDGRFSESQRAQALAPGSPERVVLFSDGVRIAGRDRRDLARVQSLGRGRFEVWVTTPNDAGGDRVFFELRGDSLLMLRDDRVSLFRRRSPDPG